MTFHITRGHATFSENGFYRYDLTRRLALEGPSRTGTVVFVLLNPSTADDKKEDPTVRRCLGFASRWNFESVRILNIFALRSTDPDALYGHPDPVGPDNDDAISKWSGLDQAARVVLAWGSHGEFRDRGFWVGQGILALRNFTEVYCFGATKRGQPLHPLYLRADRPLVEITSNIPWMQKVRA